MYHIIINPVAGHGHSLALLPILTSLFESHGKTYTTLTTQGPMDARVLARKSCAGGSEGIIGIGGDGTLQEIVTGMLEANGGDGIIGTPLGIMPCGSGNDFALTLGYGKNRKKNDREAVETFFGHILRQRTWVVDLIRADGMACLNIANLGLDARIVKNAAGLKKTYGGNAYLAAAYKSIVQHKNVPMKIDINGETLEGAYTLIAICNGQYYGGGMRIAPHARVDDGRITVCLVDAMSRPKAMAIFPSVLIEQHVRFKELRFIECTRLSLHLTDTEFLCVDGNLYDRTGTLTFEIMPGALKLFMSGPAAG